MSISLSMPPLLLPRSTEASWFGASSLDEDAALAKMEEALQQQLLGIKNFNSDIPIVGRGREAAGGAVGLGQAHGDLPEADAGRGAPREPPRAGPWRWRGCEIRLASDRM